MRVSMILFALTLTCGFAGGQPPTTAAANRDKLDLEIAVAKARSPEKCECYKGKVMTFKDAAASAAVRRVPVVVYADVDVRCCGDAIPVQMTVADAKLIRPEKPIVVYIPVGDGKVLQCTDLPANASPADIKAAVKAAQKQIDAKK